MDVGGVYRAATTTGLVAGCDRRCARTVRRAWTRRTWWGARSCGAARCASGLLATERASVLGAPRSPAACTVRSDTGWRVPDWPATTTAIAIAAAKAANANLRTRRGAPARWRAIVRGPHSGAAPGCVRIHAPGRASTAVITRQRSDFERRLLRARPAGRGMGSGGRARRPTCRRPQWPYRAGEQPARSPRQPDRLGGSRRAFLLGRGATPRCSSARRTWVPQRPCR